ncbi:protein ORANGE-LIKE, chloroplastic-like [Wolffia australiana]
MVVAAAAAAGLSPRLSLLIPSSTCGNRSGIPSCCFGGDLQPQLAARGRRPIWRIRRREVEQWPRRPACCSLSEDGDSAPNADIPSSFCIIEGPETVQDFVQMQLQEIRDNIKSRRNKIFLLMEEVRRLRVQQRIKSVDLDEMDNEEIEMPDIPSTIPFVPRLTTKTLKQLYLTAFSTISGIIVFGGLLAPTLELKLGIGGTSYEDFIRSLHLPLQLSQVDPIVASFSGGAVGVISALMLIEVNNVEQQEKKRCKYCNGTGYLTCARCSGGGTCLTIEPIAINGDSAKLPLRVPTTRRCLNCSGSGKVMCPTCLCTGMIMASEHDPRIEPFD